ncbi:ATP-binding protein [Geomicrobium sp. JSM 1781026]|uniref:sensor histidine kinase n=1 Tax=Geomicrobium sp. JSM 1781026 TaxID=3344580 RepID=UPI0035BF0E55
MKLRTKLQVAAAITLVLFVALTNTIVYHVYETISAESELERVQGQSESIAELVSSAIENDLPVQQILSETYVPNDGMVRIINQNDETVTTITREQRFLQFPTRYTNQHEANTQMTDEDERFAFVYTPIVWEDGTIVTLEVSERLVGMEENMALLGLILVVASLLALIPAILGGWLLGAIILRPIHSLIHRMNSIQEKGSLQTIDEKRRRRDELQQLIDGFNAMIERLRVQFEKQDQFVSDASHELRTPLTIIDGYASMLKRWGKTKPDMLDEAIEAITSESTRMKQLAEQLLLLVKDEEHLTVNKADINVVTVVQHSVLAMEVATERDVRFSSSDELLIANADEQMLQQLTYILLDNAFKYSEDHVDVQVVKAGTNVELTVTDYGNGITPSEQTKIFDRFYRIEKSRSRAGGGSGLGLAIASKLVSLHNGTIGVDSVPREQTTFTVTLPMKG